MALTDVVVRQVKYSGKSAGDKHADGQGMYLLVKAAGKYWRLNYRFGGKEKTLALGVYPEVTLAEARKRRADARAQLAQGIDPVAAKHKERRAAEQLPEQALVSEAEAWREADTLRAYIAHLLRAVAVAGGKPSSALSAWLVRATQVADRLDPTQTRVADASVEHARVWIVEPKCADR
jgi:hypothetical protein